VGPCATCGKSFEIGEQFSMYMLKTVNPEHTRPGGILLCRECSYKAMTTPSFGG
jgi:DNA-directed RNA polymerase subunit RPC12/RpoP